MSMPPRERLYNLLPAVYRVRDVEQGEPLRALLGVIESELRLVEDDITRLYDNWFIETCDEWVVPYLGDLLGVRNLQPIKNSSFTQRAFIANTLAYRRRKGTAAMLEQLARDVSGWPAKAVEFFELLATTQYINHVRPGKGGTIDLRDTNALELLNTPFESAAHTGEVRHIDNNRGKYNIPNIGLFLWRLQSYELERSTPRVIGNPADGRYTFSSLGNDSPLFNRPQTEFDISQLAAEDNVPAPLRRRPLFDELEARRQALVADKMPRGLYFDNQPVFQIFVSKNPGDPFNPLRPEEILICDLSDWSHPASQTFNLPDTTTFTTQFAVDPVLGRLVSLAAPPNAVQVSYAYGFPGDLGGGPYERRDSLDDPARASWIRTVSQQHPADYATLADALTHWADSNDGKKANAIIEIKDNATYEEDVSILPADEGSLTIQAANGTRPTLRLTNASGDLVITGGASPAASLTLNGLLIEGGLRIENDSLGQLRLAHCTLVPGRSLQEDGQPAQPQRPSLVVESTTDQLRVRIERSIVGALRLPAEIARLEVQDSLIDSPSRGGAARIVPALLSGPLAPFSPLTGATPAVQVTIGEEGPHVAVFGGKPTNLDEARDQLQTAIRAAHDSPAFKDARVITIPGRDQLIILPGAARAVTIEPAAADPTATELKLDRNSSRQTFALLSGPLTPFPTLTSASPTLNVTIGGEGSHVANLPTQPTSLAEASDQLQAAIRAVPGSAAFTSALVGRVEDRLVVLPGVGTAPVLLDVAAADQTTLSELALQTDRPAIAASAGGEQAGPPTRLERMTILGPVHVKELILASEVIFNDPVIVDRRQSSSDLNQPPCVRFSYVPDGSRTPRRYYCQPDLAIKAALAAAKQAHPSISNAEQQRVEADTRMRLTPSFAATRYGTPAYGQLSRSCAKEIRTGAEDENEMGAFNFLQQELRINNLRASLDEYLRFGLEAGIFLVT